MTKFAPNAISLNMKPQNGYFYHPKLAGVFAELGGEESVRQISVRFHQKVLDDPILSRLFPKSIHKLEESLSLFVAELTGGS